MTNNFNIHEWRLQQALKELDKLAEEQDKLEKNKSSKDLDEQPVKMYHDAEDLEEDYSLTEDDWMQPDDESDMAHSQLYSIKHLSSELCDIIDDGEQLDAWVQAKLTKAEDYLQSVYNYIKGEEVRDEPPTDHSINNYSKDNVILGARFVEEKLKRDNLSRK